MGEGLWTNTRFALHQGIRYLLGDPVDDRKPDDAWHGSASDGAPSTRRPLRVDGWADALNRMRAGSKLEGSFTQQRNIEEHMLEPMLEMAFAHLHDSRIVAAMNEFSSVAHSCGERGGEVPKRAEMNHLLARLGHGGCFTARGRFAAGDDNLKKAVREAEQLGDETALAVARLLLLINYSDWGHGPAGELIAQVEQMRWSADLDVPLKRLLEAYRMYALSRAQLRAGKRADALQALAQFVDRPGFHTIVPVARSRVLRMYGIMLTVTGNAAAARSVLDDCVGICHAAGYQVGEALAALSLARLNLSIDKHQSADCLARVEHILHDVDAAHALEQERARQMPTIQAAWLSRKAELEFSRGNVERAVQLCREDVRLMSAMSGPEGPGMPRSQAHAHRNLGRMLLTAGRPAEAVDQLRESAQLFSLVDDQWNEFFSNVRLCEALLVRGRSADHTDAQALISRLDETLSSAPDRHKERAMVNVVRAKFYWVVLGEPEKARWFLKDALSTLLVSRDYHYVWARLVEADILIACQDIPTARWHLRDARHCAINLQMEDLRQQIDERLRPIDTVPEPDGSLVGRCTLAILFADIRGFTAACQSTDNEMMAEFIAEFATNISHQVGQCAGRPVRFLGDCVMAVFDESAAMPMEYRAVEAASLIHERFRNMRDRWMRKSDVFGEVGLGFGVAVGEVIAGRFGSEELSEYSMIGGAVNLASRLQGHAEDGEILLSPECAGALVRVAPQLGMGERQIEAKGFGLVQARSLYAQQTHALLPGAKIRAVAPGDPGVGGPAPAA